jgi:hypothetical protein
MPACHIHPPPLARHAHPPRERREELHPPTWPIGKPPHQHSACLPPARAQKAANERLQRFYVPPPLPAGIGSTLLLDGPEGAHAVKVLRLRAGDRVQLCDGEGRLLTCRIVSTDKAGAMVSGVLPYILAESAGAGRACMS